MTRAMKSFSAVVCGALLIILALIGWFGEISVFRAGVRIALAGTGLLVLLVGAGGLLSTQSRARLRPQHHVVYGLLILAIFFHVLQNIVVAGNFWYGWFLWALLPYGLVLVLSCFEDARLPVIAGAALALAVDAWNWHDLVRSTGSKAIGFYMMPLWNTLIVVPVATFIARLFLQRRHKVSANAP